MINPATTAETSAPRNTFSPREWRTLAQERDPASAYIIGREVLPSLVFKAPEVFTKILHSADWPGKKYLEFFHGMHSPDKREELKAQFPLTNFAQQILGKEGAKILIVLGEQVGLGDELADAATFLQAVVDRNPWAKVTVLTSRPQLYNHPQIEINTADWQNSHNTYKQFDVVVDYGNTGPYWLPSPRGSAAPPIFIRPRAIRNQHPEILFNGELQSTRLPLNSNVYMPGFMLCAEFGLDFRWGSQQPYLSILVGNCRSEEFKTAHAYWNRELFPGKNKEGLPTALYNPFGGTEEAKGTANTPEGNRQCAEEIKLLLSEGYFVLLAPNGKPWGSSARANELYNLLSERDQGKVFVLPEPDKNPALLKYMAAWSDCIYTCEGGMVHLAYHLGKPFRTIANDFAKTTLPTWTPTGADQSQGVITGIPEVTRPLKEPLLAAKAEAKDSEVRPTHAHLKPVAAKDLSEYLGAALQKQLSGITGQTLGGQVRTQVHLRLIPELRRTLGPAAAPLIAELQKLAQRQEHLYRQVSFCVHTENIYLPPILGQGLSRLKGASIDSARLALGEILQYTLVRAVGIKAGEILTEAGVSWDKLKQSVITGQEALRVGSTQRLLSDPTDIFFYQPMAMEQVDKITNPALQAKILTRGVIAEANSFMWHYEHGLDLGLTPSLAIKELLPLVQSLIERTAGLYEAQQKLDGSLTAAEQFRINQALAAGIFCIEESMYKSPGFDQIIASDPDPRNQAAIYRLQACLDPMEKVYQHFLKLGNEQGYKFYNVLFDRPESLLQAATLERIWVNNPASFALKYNSLHATFEKDDPHLSTIALIPCFGGEELRVYPTITRAVRHKFQGDLQMSAGKIQ